MMYEISFPRIFSSVYCNCAVVLNLLGMQMQVQERFEVDIKELPEQIDTATYSMYSLLD